MAEAQSSQNQASNDLDKPKNEEKKTPPPKRQIAGNLPYTPSIGVFERTLAKIIECERPATFTRDFLNTVLDVSGGASNPVIPILKKVGFITDSGVPTEQYSGFQTASGRPAAALNGLKRGFSEIFKRNQYAHKAARDKLTDIIISITGLPKTERAVGYICNTFEAFQKYAREANDDPDEVNHVSESAQRQVNTLPSSEPNASIDRLNLGLSYQINIVLPETSNVDVFNAIFKSLRENLLK